ncbi:DUF6578 domain-containing protein [Nocardioides sp.]|uniref:DUF6578 domain-containing protein n=1 Tax=Nocardioides sp. TaxID=35761 RepID=UPI00286C901E|nr:DUF6578 domain-containing protein [Nocardioides sp.]
MRVRVWVDAWHLRCCAPPFEVGDRVAWPLATDAEQSGWLEEVLGADLARTVTFTEDHHDALPVATPETHGVVQSITAATMSVGTSSGAPAPALLVDVRGAEGGDMSCHGHRLLGYVVVLEVSAPAP